MIDRVGAGAPIRIQQLPGLSYVVVHAVPRALTLYRMIIILSPMQCELCVCNNALRARTPVRLVENPLGAVVW